MATVELKCPVTSCDMGEGVPYKTEKVEKDMAWGRKCRCTVPPPTQPQARKQAQPVRDNPKQNVPGDHPHPQRAVHQPGGLQPLPQLIWLGPGLVEHVSKMLYRSRGAELTKFTEQQLYQNINVSCVTKQTDKARTTELHRIKQDPG